MKTFMGDFLPDVNFVYLSFFRARRAADLPHCAGGAKQRGGRAVIGDIGSQQNLGRPQSAPPASRASCPPGQGSAPAKWPPGFGRPTSKAFPGPVWPPPPREAPPDSADSRPASWPAVPPSASRGCTTWKPAHRCDGSRLCQRPCCPRLRPTAPTDRRNDQKPRQRQRHGVRQLLEKPCEIIRPPGCVQHALHQLRLGKSLRQSVDGIAQIQIIINEPGGQNVFHHGPKLAHQRAHNVRAHKGVCNAQRRQHPQNLYGDALA